MRPEDKSIVRNILLGGFQMRTHKEMADDLIEQTSLSPVRIKNLLEAWSALYHGEPEYQEEEFLNRFIDEHTLDSA